MQSPIRAPPLAHLRNDLACPARQIGTDDTHLRSPDSSYPWTMTDATIVTLSVMFLAFVVEEATCRLVADLHRRRVPEWAWKAAGVDRLFWGFLGINIYVPLSDFYYLVKVRGRLDRAQEPQTRPLSH